MRTQIVERHSKLLNSGIFALTAVALFAGTVAPAIGQGNVGNPDILPPQSHFGGHTYSEWSAEWFKYVYALPTNRHPLFDNADCSVGQTGNVWFIDGRLGGIGFPPGGRTCTIPAGTALFLSLNNSKQDNEGCSADKTMIQKTNFTEKQLREKANNELVDNYGFRKIIIDGVEVEGLPPAEPDEARCSSAHPENCQSPYRVQTPVFSYTVPAFNNILIQENGDNNGDCSGYNNPNSDGSPYTVNGAVADGFYVMIKPLPIGDHIIKFGPLDDAGNPTRTYRITVSAHYEQISTEKQSFH